MTEPTKVFISYAREDIETARRLYNDLKKDYSFINDEDANNRKLLKQVVNTLGMAQRRKNSRIKIGLDCFGILRFKNIVNYLYKEKQGNFDEFQFEEIIDDSSTFPEIENLAEEIEVNSCGIKIMDSCPQGRSILCKSNQIQMTIFWLMTWEKNLPTLNQN